jgi:hypothetical protein
MPCLIFNDEMNTNNVIKRLYVSPWCETVEMELIGLLCSTVFPDGNYSTQPSDWSYDNKGEHDVGGVVVGDDSSIAPAKYNEFWGEE